jgi:S1-C subfamily serine protease
MPVGLRFCRNCGYRLGEGLAEYTETMRFQNGAGAVPATTTKGVGWSAGQVAPAAAGQLQCRKKGMSGMTWIFVAIVAFFVTAGVVTQFIRPVTRRITNIGIPTGPPAPRASLGIEELDTVDEGVVFESVGSPDSPADKAGLVGGDIITSFDGQAVKEEDDLIQLLTRTPIGKTVDVVYLRDGETKTTKLTTISEGELKQLGRTFATRPEGQGFLGITGQRTVEIPNTKMHGVELTQIQSSRPADLAGLKTGDIIIEFNKTPIRTQGELLRRIRRVVPYTTVDVLILRDGARMVIPVKIGPNN